MPDKRDLEPLLNVEQNQLNLVMSDSNTIETRALAIFGVNIAVLIFIGQASLHLAIWQFIVLYVPFILSLLLDVLSIWPRQYLKVTKNRKSSSYLNMGRETLILQLLANTQTVTQHNEMLNNKRQGFCSASIVLTSLGFVALLFII